MKFRSPFIILWLLSGAAVVHGDVVAVDGRPPAMGATLLALHNGQLTYRLSSGREATRPIDQIEYIQVSGWNVFNAAEKQQRDKQYREAALNYEKALTETTEPSTRFDRGLLARCRLVRVYDADGQFDRAVRVYLEVLDTAEGGVFVDMLRPQRLPESGSTFLQPAMEMLDRSIQKHAQDAIAKSLRAWRITWPGASTQPGFEEAATPIIRPLENETASPRADLAEIRRLVEKGRFKTAIEQIAQWQKESAPLPAELFYWQGRAWLGATTEKVDEAAVNRKRAGLAFMRVVIHFPEHAYAPECLYRAGEICLQATDRQQAAGLWSGLLDRYPTAEPWTDQARQSLQKMNRDAAAAAGTTTEK